MTLTFNIAGGPIISGEGHLDYTFPLEPNCPPCEIYATYTYRGSYDAETNTFVEGTVSVAAQGPQWSEECELVEVGEDFEWECECVSEAWGFSHSGTWQAAFEDGVVSGSQSFDVTGFELTVQGQ